jgi:NTP pyrophosphatase (non-canonical NTP hydrolase)
MAKQITQDEPGGRTMNANEYQELAARTLIDAPDAEYTDAEIMLVWNALGLAGEAGEVANSIKKMVVHRHGVDRDELVKELGDVLWYVAALCTKLDVPMSTVMERNIAKLMRRYPDGYCSADSQARKDVV